VGVLSRVCTPSSLEREGERERARDREREKEKRGERDVELYRIVILIFKRNDRCLGTF
jgi:hypothetical protein